MKTSVKPVASRPTTSSLADLFGGLPAPPFTAPVAPAKPKNLLGSLFDPKPAATETVSSEEVKLTTLSTSKPRSLFSSLFDEPKSEPSSSSEAVARTVVAGTVTEESGGAATKVEITRVYDFAGEMVK